MSSIRGALWVIRTHRALPCRALTSPRRGTRIFEAQRIFEDLVQAGPPDFTFREGTLTWSPRGSQCV